MSYHLTPNQRAKFADFNLDRPRLAQLAATVTDKYGLSPQEAWTDVVTYLDCYMHTREDIREVRRITASCRAYSQHLDEMEKRGLELMDNPVENWPF